MPVEMIVRIREVSGKTEIEIVGSKGEGTTANEMAHSVALAEMVAMVAKDVASGNMGCDCPECQQARGRERERKNLH